MNVTEVINLALAVLAGTVAFAFGRRMVRK
jgi:hypothetical protein